MKRLICCLFICALYLPASASLAQETIDAYDRQKAVIFSYSRISDDADHAHSLPSAVFGSHINEIIKGNYTVLPLPKIVKQIKAAESLPPGTIGLSFDGNHRSLLDHAWPLLKQHDIPFTVFVAPGYVPETSNALQTGWDALKDMHESGLATIGLHPDTYSSMTLWDETTTRTQINAAKVRLRKAMNVEARLFAYPFGAMSLAAKQVVAQSGFDAAFAQQSGVLHPGANMMTLPRFTLSGHFGSLQRFIMTANALPFPVTELKSPDPVITDHTQHIAIGFTLPEDRPGQELTPSCYSNFSEKPAIEKIGNNRIEIRVKTENAPERLRLNCTLPAPKTAERFEQSWRWLGFLFHVEQPVFTGKTDQ